MSKVCEIVDEATLACLKWVDNLTVIDQLAITKQDALMILTPIGSIYVLLIGWSFIMLVYHQSK